MLFLYFQYSACSAELLVAGWAGQLMEMTVAAEYLLLLLERGSRGQESRPQRGTVTAGAEAWAAAG